MATAPAEFAGVADAQPATERLTILHLLSGQHWSGPAAPTLLLATQQRAEGHAVFFACGRGSTPERRLQTFDFPLVEGFNFERHPQPRRMMADIRRLRQWVARQRPDVIHCHQPHDHWLAALALRRPLGARRGAPIIVRTMHREDEPRTDLIHRWLVGKGCDLVLAISQSQKKQLLERVGLPAPRVVAISGTVDLDLLRPPSAEERAALRRQHGLPAEGLLVGMMARLQAGRGHLLLLETLAEVSERFADLGYVLVGRGELKPQVLARLQHHPQAGRVHRFGLRREAWPTLLPTLDLLVQADAADDGGQTVREAMACGVPVVAARHGELADVVQEGETGWQYEPGNLRDLTQTLALALSDRQRLAAAGEAGRLRAERHHSPALHSAATLAAYAEAMARRARLAGSTAPVK